MADWKTVRFDPTYTEPLDPEIIPLLDAMNDAGFVTLGSCCGHGTSWPYVVFEHSTDERIERLARFIKSREEGDFRPSWTRVQKEILPVGYDWSVHLHLNNVYHDTPPATALADAVTAINRVAALVREFASVETLNHGRHEAAH